MANMERAQTLIEAIARATTAALRVSSDVAEPVTLLWTDPEEEWKPLIPQLHSALPQLYVNTGGTQFDPANRAGPPIWLKCVVDRALPDHALSPGQTPIIYLPGVRREQLRAGESCPSELQPLVELVYRGRVWHHKNGNDWTVSAFLASEHVGLQIASDGRTREAMLRALPMLASAPLYSLRGRELSGGDFDKLAVDDPQRVMLSWIGAPDDTKRAMQANAWQAFRSQSKKQFKIDPDSPGALDEAARRLIVGGGEWDKIWTRFSEAPLVHRSISKRLRETVPELGGEGQQILIDRSRDPAANEAEEKSLREALGKLASASVEEACDAVTKLEAEHGRRRQWVWSQLGEAPLANALEPLARLAAVARSPIGDGSVSETARSYASAGWKCDSAALEALAATSIEPNASLVRIAVVRMYEGWLRKTTDHFQYLARKEKGWKTVAPSLLEPGSCRVFVDGLRCDLAARLAEMLESAGLEVERTMRLAPLPTVTATAKPITVIDAPEIGGVGESEDFVPTLAGTGKAADTKALTAIMAAAGVQLLDATQIVGPTEPISRGWVECGNIDNHGHKVQAKLVNFLEEELVNAAHVVQELIHAGWSKVQVVTDHGWLLLPLGLPKVELPAHLVGVKWARCVRAKGAVSEQIPTFPWYWNDSMTVASPPGIGSFAKGNEYAHGGVSLQECVVLDLSVAEKGQRLRAKIVKHSWRGMMCRVRVEGDAKNLRIDLRKVYGDPSTSVLESGPKELDSGGEATLIVSDDHEGHAVSVVVLGSDGRIAARASTTVGEA